MSARSRAIAWRHGAHAAVCDRVEPWRYGNRVTASRFPRYWDYNTLRLEGAAPAGLTAQALADVADEHQLGLAHRKIELEDESTGERLRPDFARLGWRTTRLAWMQYEETGVEPYRGVVQTVSERVRPLRAEWLRAEAEDYGGGPSGVESFLTDEQTVASLLPGQVTTFAAFDHAGDPAAYCTLRIAGECGDVEDVYCTPEQRGRGMATSLVTAAVTRALDHGVRNLFIVADQDDWPKDLYARLGFRTVWIRHDAVLRPI